MKIRLLIFGIVLFPIHAISSGWTNWATPTRIDVERGGGIMVYGDYGNPNKCKTENKFYVVKDHPQYDQIYSAVLAAFASGSRVQAHIRDCKSYGWYTHTDDFNELNASGSLNIQK